MMNEHFKDAEALAETTLKGSLVYLVVAAWLIGGALWSAQYLGPIRWLGGFLQLAGFFWTLRAIGMTWRSAKALRGVRRDRSRPSFGPLP